MELNKKTILKIIGIVAAGIFISWALKNYELVFGTIGGFFRILWPLILGFFIAFVLNLPMRFFERRVLTRTKSKKLAALRRPLCILLSILAIVGILTLVFSLVIPELIGAFTVIGQEIPEFLRFLEKWAAENEQIFPQAEEFLDSLQIDWNVTVKKLLDLVTESAGSLLGSTVSIVSGIVGSIFNAIMAFIFALYILLDKETLKRQIRRLSCAVLPRRWSETILFVTHLSGKTFEKFVSGQVTEACILGTLCWLGMALLRLPYATMIGALVGFTALIPIVGAWIGAIVGAFMIGMQSLTQAVIFIVFLLILQQVEGNVIYPRVVGSSVGLPPMWVLAAITLGGSMWGIAGMLFAVPVCSILYALTRLFVHCRLDGAKGITARAQEDSEAESAFPRD